MIQIAEPVEAPDAPWCRFDDAALAEIEALAQRIRRAQQFAAAGNVVELAAHKTRRVGR